MGLTKTEGYTPGQIALAKLAKALGHPARIAIIQHLLKIRSCICGDIVESLPLAQPTVSQHLRELKEAGLIKGTIHGTAACYCVDTERWNEMITTLKNIIGCSDTAPSDSDTFCC